MQTITVTIKNGAAKVETEGFVGATCQDATKDLEAAMGLTSSDEKTPEFHQREQQVIGN